MAKEVAFEEEKTSLFDWKIVLAVSIIYSLNAFILEGASSLFPHEERIIIMVPAFASVVFGPVIGGFGSGFGNLLLDIFDKYILTQEGLAARHILGFFANMLGGIVVGVYSKRLVIGEDESILSRDNLALTLKNTLASVFGLAVVTGAMIGFGRWLLSYVALDYFTFSDGATLAGIIITSNGIVLLVSMIPLQLLFMFIEQRRARNYSQQLAESQTLHCVTSTPDAPVEIVEFKGYGEGYVLRHWTTTKLAVRNALDVPMRYRVEVRAQDHLTPTVFYTELLQPRAVDYIDLQLYPFDDADRKVRLVFRPWVDQRETLREVFAENNQFTFEYTYKVLMPANRRFRVLISIVGIMALIVGLVRAIQSVLIGGTGTAPFILTIGIVLLEVIAVLLWYLLKKRTLGVD